MSDRYKVKLESGRILGPLDLSRFRELVDAGHISGSETARKHPDGDWKPIEKIPALAEALILTLKDGKGTQQTQTKPVTSSMINPIQGDDANSDGSTQILPSSQESGSSAGNKLAAVSLGESPGASNDEPAVKDSPPGREEDQEDKTVVDVELEKKVELENDTEGTQIADPLETPAILDETPGSEFLDLGSDPVAKQIGDEKTVQFIREADTNDQSSTPGKRKNFIREGVFGIIIALSLGISGYELFLKDEPKGFDPQKSIRPVLPKQVKGKPNPKKSMELYGKAIPYYLEDNVVGYRKAAGLLLKASAYDINNVKALAILASCYINLIDSSKKDEKYFSTISKLIERARAKSVDLPETVISDVEFFVTIQRPAAGKKRIVEYTKKYQNFGVEMYYYLSYAFFYEGDYQNASRYLTLYPDHQVSSPRAFYLRGLVAEKLNDPNKAILEYDKAIKLQPRHVKSHLRKSFLLEQSGNLKDASPHLNYLIKKPHLLSPRDLGLAYYLHGRLNEVNREWNRALSDMEKAVLLDRKNHQYLFELFTLRSRTGEKSKKEERKAKMYFFLAEGEKHLQSQDYHSALTQFLQARQVYSNSYVPLVKIGDMFLRQGDIQNALLNYEKAAKLAPKKEVVWSKYIDVLIRSYEWEKANQSMDRLRKLSVNPGILDKLAGDMYTKQNRFKEALTYYKKALSRETIDPEVYIAYADALVKTNNAKDAPFFYALARRFDPLNLRPVLGTARAIASEDSVNSAIRYLRGELLKDQAHTAEILAAVAEFQIQKGEWVQAQASVREAIQTNPKAADPYRIQARILVERKEPNRQAIQKAIEAYRSYSDRRPSDPRGYLERYRLYSAQANYERASHELGEIYAIYPKYPNLHYLKGLLYSTMGRTENAVQEFKLELKNNPYSVNTNIELGKIYMSAKEYQDSLQFFSTAMKLAPKSAIPRIEAGWANYYLGNYDGAVALFRMALRYDPANPIAYKRLGLTYLAMGNRSEASQAFKRYLEIEPDAPDRGRFQKYL